MARVAPDPSALPRRDIAWADLAPDSAPPLVGGFGVVFSARWQRRRVAVKVPIAVVLHGAVGGDVSAVLAEAATLVRASDDGANDYVVKLLGVARGPAPSWAAACERGRAAWAERAKAAPPPPAGGSLPHLLGLVMDWAEGGSLEAALFPPGAARAPWPQELPDKLRLLCEVAEGLWRLHGAGVVHGDIKAENVLLSAAVGAERHVRLADFGFSTLRAVADEALRSSQLSRVYAATDVVRGTPAYMAPEMKASRAQGALVPAVAANRSTDTYAFGTLAWEVLVGERPWEGYDEAARLADIRSGQTLDIGKLPRILPSESRAVLARCLDRDRSARPRVAEVLQSLEQARDTLEGGGRRRQVFLSYCWAGGRRKPLATEVYLALGKEGYSTWIDQVEMQHDLRKSMYEGISNCDVFVALLSPDYAASENCLFELRCAVVAQKPVVACCAEPGFWRSWLLPNGSRAVPDDHELAVHANLQGGLWVDLGEASAVDWGAEPVPEAERRKLTQKPEALPCLLRLVQQHAAAAREGGAASPRRKVAAPAPGPAASLAHNTAALAERLLLLAAEDRAGVAASASAGVGAEARLLARQRALQEHAAAIDAAIGVLREKRTEALKTAAAKETEAAQLDAAALRATSDAAALVEAAKAAYLTAVAKSSAVEDVPARIKRDADKARADLQRDEAVYMQESAAGLRAAAAELRAAAEKAAAADARAAARRSEQLAAAGLSGADLLRERATAKAEEAQTIRRRALSAAQFGGSNGAASDVEAAEASIGRLLQARAALAEAEQPLPGTQPGWLSERGAVSSWRTVLEDLARADAQASEADAESAQMLEDASALGGKSKARLEESAAAEARAATDLRAAALSKGGFSGSSAAALGAAISSVRRYLLAEAALTAAEEAVSGAPLRSEVISVAELALRAKAASLADARRAAEILDGESSRLRGEEAGARAQALGDGDALIQAIERRDEGAARALIARGGAFAVAFVDKGARTPLTSALAAGLDGLAVLLIEQGADVKRADEAGRMPRDLCASGRVPRARALVVAKGGVTASAAHAADGARLIDACRRGDAAGASALLRAGADVTIIAGDGNTALLLACAAGLDEVACDLISKGANINAICGGKTAVEIAAPRCCRGSKAPRALEALRARGALGAADAFEPERRAARERAARAAVAELVSDEVVAPPRVVALLRDFGGDSAVGPAVGEAAARLLVAASAGAGAATCVAAGAPAALATLAATSAAKANSSTAQNVAGALANMAGLDDAGRIACVTARAPAALVALASSAAVAGSSAAVQSVALAMKQVASIEAGRAASVAAGVPAALVTLAATEAVRCDAAAAENVASAMSAVANSDECRPACIAAGVAASLTRLAGARVVKDSPSASLMVACAITNIAVSEGGRAACVAAAAPAALVGLAAAEAVRASAGAATYIAWAFTNISWSAGPHRAACVAAGALTALRALAAQPAAKSDAEASAKLDAALAKLESRAEAAAAAELGGTGGTVAPTRVVALLREFGGDSAVGAAAAKALVAASAGSGRAACVAAGAPAALVTLAGKYRGRRRGGGPLRIVPNPATSPNPRHTHRRRRHEGRLSNGAERRRRFLQPRRRRSWPRGLRGGARARRPHCAFVGSVGQGRGGGCRKYRACDREPRRKRRRPVRLRCSRCTRGPRGLVGGSEDQRQRRAVRRVGHGQPRVDGGAGTRRVRPCRRRRRLASARLAAGSQGRRCGRRQDR